MCPGPTGDKEVEVVVHPALGSFLCPGDTAGVGKHLGSIKGGVRGWLLSTIEYSKHERI